MQMENTYKVDEEKNDDDDDDGGGGGGCSTSFPLPLEATFEALPLARAKVKPSTRLFRVMHTIQDARLRIF